MFPESTTARYSLTVVELIAKERCRQGRVDEAGGNEVDSDERESEREPERPKEGAVLCLKGEAGDRTGPSERARLGEQ